MAKVLITGGAGFVGSHLAPQVELEQGMVEPASWLEGREAEDKVIEARQEPAMRGLTA